MSPVWTGHKRAVAVVRQVSANEFAWPSPVEPKWQQQCLFALYSGREPPGLYFLFGLLGEQGHLQVFFPVIILCGWEGLRSL